MNSITFIKQHGVEMAREVVEGAPEGATKFNTKTEQYLKTIKVATIGYPTAGMVTQAFHRGLREACSIDLSDLKRVVESVELVKEHYTLARAKKYAASPYTAPELKRRLEQAIADYEAIGGEHV